MKDRYLYRGKRKDNGAWETGNLVVNKQCTAEEMFFISDKMTAQLTAIDPETLGQCTGERDSNGKLIFEGDEVKYNKEFGIDGMFTVEWSDYSLRFVICNELTVFDNFTDMSGCDFEVVGNIHEEESA